MQKQFTFKKSSYISYIGGALVVLAVAALFMHLLSDSHAAGTPLSWAPPSCGGSGFGCVDINLSNTGVHQTPLLSASNDYRIHLPSSGPLVGGITISGGHNIIIIGGEIDLTYPCANDASNCMGIYITRSSPGQVFVEGVYIKNPGLAAATAASCPGGGQTCSTGDGIGMNITGGTTDATFENMLVEGISGCSGGADHADVFQPYQAPGSTIHIDHLTASTNCQGLQIDPDLAGSNPPHYDIRATNIVTLRNPYSGLANRYIYWFTGGPPECTTGGVQLTNGLEDYASEPNGTLSINSVWPDTDQPSACKGVWNAGTNQYTFPNTNNGSLKITGYLKQGTPPGGDYVATSNTGIGYVSPGYVGASTTGDLNGDGKVTIVDLSMLLSQWGTNGSADLNHDNMVNISDLSILLSHWTV